MRRLRGGQASLYNILLLVCILFFFNCQKKDQLKKDESKFPAGLNKNLSKEAFFECSTAKDTVFKNGDYIRFVPLKKSYGIEIKIRGIIDTLSNYSFDCNSYNGMIPKLLFKTDYIVLTQGSSTNYRYLITCSLNNEKDKIDVNKFENEIVEISESEILFFQKDSNVFFFNRKNGKLFFKKLPNEIFNHKFKKFELYRDKVRIVFEQGYSLTYKLNEFANVLHTGS
ncbi:hypothetical protein [Flavobacterium sp. CLA17]|uniref:hypothetical protein n=1 Tax=Flavobacterium sp. CLA17 TaxID=2724135 RepID=UPI0014930B28|nr:hypothetical protein [Flavobacterium sp. CLA17]QSB26487.1 hypothetical protein HAV12_019295 [Flavobacterium sp. CLA17]